MNGFTSGTQARDGRTVNHDPESWDHPTYGRAAWPYTGTGWQLAPRSEFAVLDNPILAAAREYAEFKMGSHHDMLRSVRLGEWDEDATFEQVEHARRVLSKWAVL